MRKKLLAFKLSKQEKEELRKLLPTLPKEEKKK